MLRQQGPDQLEKGEGAVCDGDEKGHLSELGTTLGMGV